MGETWFDEAEGLSDVWKAILHFKKTTGFSVVRIEEKQVGKAGYRGKIKSKF